MIQQITRSKDDERECDENKETEFKLSFKCKCHRKKAG